MALTAPQRLQLARALQADLTIRRITGQQDREQELLRMLVLPQATQVAEFKAAVARVKALLESQQTEAPSQRAAQYASWATDIATMDDLTTNIS
jgi:hypothetical protein